jgi:carbonic anhydrase
VELNVIEQVGNLTETSIVQRAWRDHKRPMLHGWVYDLHTGLLNSMIEVLPGSAVEPIYRYDF